jgi:hypothetical protein
VQRMVTPIVLVGPALQQSFAFELVDEGHHSAGERPESLGKCALTYAWFTGKDCENAGVRRSELQHGQPGGKSRGGVCADVSKQGCRARAGTCLRCRPLVDRYHMKPFSRLGDSTCAFWHRFQHFRMGHIFSPDFQSWLVRSRVGGLQDRYAGRAARESKSR